MERLTKRDEFGNTDIIGVDSEELQCNLDFEEFNKVTNALNRLAGYEDLQEQNKLLILTVAVGDKVWSITSNANYSLGAYKEVPLIYPQDKNIVSITISRNGILYHVKDRAYSELDFGKTVFLTKEQAESALKEL